jgi:hypothetical protein
VLEGLDDIDWAALKHAYGTAEDVPELIRNLGSGDVPTRVPASPYGLPTTPDALRIYAADGEGRRA